MLWWMLQTSVVAAALAVVVAIVCRLGRLRPAVQHALWLVVLLKLATPNVIQWPWRVADVASQLHGAWEAGQKMEGDIDLETSSSAGSPPGDPSADWTGNAQDVWTAPRALSDEERELVERVLVAESRPVDVRESAETIGEVERAAGAVSAGLRPPLAGGIGVARSDEDVAQVNGEILSNLLIVLWACGAAVYCGRQLVRIARFQRRLRGGRAVPDWLQQTVVELSAELRVRPPRMLVTRDMPSPCLWCLGSPRLIWPERLAEDAQPARWRGIIVHELAHLRRRDHWVAWLELAVGCVWWWNPLYWLVRRQVRATADLACDAWAVWLLPDGQRMYAESLLAVTQHMSRMPAAAPVLGATSGVRRSYQRRIEMIMSTRVPCRASKFGLLCAGLLAALSVPAWSLDDNPPPSADTGGGPPASTGAGVVPGASPAAPGGAATGTSADAPPAAGGNPGSTPGKGPASAFGSDAATGAEPAADPTAAKLPDADRIARLERQLETLLIEIRSLRGEQGVSRRSMSMPGWSTRKNRANSAPAFSPDGKLIAVATEDGQIAILEAGTGKEVRRIDVGEAVNPMAMTFDPEGAVLAVDSGGRALRIDVDSGRVLSVTAHGRLPLDPLANVPAPGGPAVPNATNPPELPGATPGGPARTGTGLTAADPNAFDYGDAPATTSGGLAQSLAGAQIDLIRLSTEYVEAVGARKLAERHLSRLQGLDKANAIAEEEVVTAEVNYETASNKVALLRAIAEAAADSTKDELEFAERLEKKGFASSGSVTQLKAKLRIISLILDGGTHN